MNLDLNKTNKVYLAGIGGIGLSALAYYFLNLEKQVVGSDLLESEITQRLVEKHVDIYFKQKASNLTADIDLFIYSSALPDDHPELARAREMKIPVVSYFEFLGLLSKNYKTIAVTGTNGKTSVTAMLGLALEKAGLDPTVIVGSLVPAWNSNFRLGKSDILVVEACEWRAHMLEIDLDVIVLTNIAEDHLDFYKNLDNIKKHFQKFVDKLPQDGVLFKNIDDINSTNIKSKTKIINFGHNKQADYYFDNLEISKSTQKFDILKNNNLLNNFSLIIPGEYNVYNAVSCVAVADHLGANKHQIWNSLHEFNGTWRRFENLGEYKSNIVISDYAHHPDSIKGLLKATRDFYPDKKLIAIFQPHHHNRTQTLLDDFAISFDLADQAIISEIYQVSGREDAKHEDVSSQDLVDKIKNTKAWYAKDFDEVKNIFKKTNPVDSVLLFIGAGDIDDLARELVK